MELEEGEDVEKNKASSQRWGQREKAGGMFMGLCAKAKWGGTVEGMVWKGGQQEKGGTPTTWFHFQSGVVFLQGLKALARQVFISRKFLGCCACEHTCFAF